MVFRVAAYVTLLVDAYLLLAMIALRVMKQEYYYLLPPFGIKGFQLMPGFVLVSVIIWTGVLAIGCLTVHRNQSAKGVQSTRNDLEQEEAEATE